MGVIDDRGNRPRASASKAREATIRGLADPFDARKRRAVGSAKILLAAARGAKMAEEGNFSHFGNEARSSLAIENRVEDSCLNV